VSGSAGKAECRLVFWYVWFGIATAGSPMEKPTNVLIVFVAAVILLAVMTAIMHAFIG
jgi:hypothetical protein